MSDRYGIARDHGNMYRVYDNTQKKFAESMDKASKKASAQQRADALNKQKINEMRTYRVKVERASEEQEEVPSFELRTIAATNLSDAKHRAAKRFGMKRVKNVAPARREQTMEAFDDGDEDDYDRFELPTQMCPDCEGEGEKVNGDICTRCDGEGELYESHKPTFIQFLVESSSDERNRRAILSLDLDWSRKPSDWSEAAESESLTLKHLEAVGLTQADIPTYHLGDFYEEGNYGTKDGLPPPLKKFTMQTPRETIFFVKVPRYGTFLVNTEGADYFRYVMYVAKEPKREVNQHGVPPEWISDKPKDVAVRASGVPHSAFERAFAAKDK